MKIGIVFTALSVCLGLAVPLKAQQDRGLLENETGNAEFLLVGSYASSEEEGVRVYRFDTETGNAEYISGLTGIPNACALASSADGERIYAVSEDSKGNAAVNAIRFDKRKGRLTWLNTQPIEGGFALYISLNPEENFVLTADYKGGSITTYALDKDGALLPDAHRIPFRGSGPNAKRQTQSHPHFLTFTLDSQYLWTNDLGTDCVYLFPVGKQVEVGRAQSLLDESGRMDLRMEPGSGPRHACFHPNGKYAYLISELSGKITTFSYQNGKLERLQTIVCDPFVVDGNADIHASSDGKHLYASKRLKEDGIVIYSIHSERGTLTRVGFQPTGLYPRSFAISPDGRYLLVACRDSDCIQLFERDKVTGLLKDTGKSIPLRKPAFVKFL